MTKSWFPVESFHILKSVQRFPILLWLTSVTFLFLYLNRFVFSCLFNHFRDRDCQGVQMAP